MVLNPWKVQSIDEFNYFCCPECVFRAKEDSSFQAHALQNHVLSKTLFHGTEANDLDQGDLLKGIDNKSVRKWGISRLHPLFTYVLFSVTHSL